MSNAENKKPEVEVFKEPTRVRAKQDGFYAGFRRRAGATFTVAAGTKKAKWMMELSEAVEEVSAPSKVLPGQDPKMTDPELAGADENTLKKMTDDSEAQRASVAPAAAKTDKK